MIQFHRMNLTSFWVIWKRNQQRLGYVLVCLMMFAAGWQAGRVTSPYYASNPIIFQEAPSSSAGANNGSSEALIALRDAGLNNSAPPQIAAAHTMSPSPSAMFAGSKNSNLYHHKECPNARQIKQENIIWWTTREAAEAAGYKPSKCTQEKFNPI